MELLRRADQHSRRRIANTSCITSFASLPATLAIHRAEIQILARLPQGHDVYSSGFDRPNSKIRQFRKKPLSAYDSGALSESVATSVCPGK